MAATTRTATRYGVSRAHPSTGRRAELLRVVPAVCALLMAAPLVGVYSLRCGALLGAVLLPVTYTRLLATTSSRALYALCSFAVIWGSALAYWSLWVDPGRQFDLGLGVSQACQVLAVVLTYALTVWIVDEIGVAAFLGLWATSLALSAPFTSLRFYDQPWKFGLALPIAVLVLLAVRRRSATVQIVSLLGVTAVSVASQTRLWAAIFAVTTGLFAWTHLRHRRGARNRGSSVLSVAILAGVATIVAYSVTQLALSGDLGDYAKRRTETSVAISGNPISGGRAEWGGALALAAAQPWGIGLGIAPSSTDWTTVVRSLTLDPQLQDDSDVSRDLRRGFFEFHSGFWNLWVYTGWIGTAIASCCLLVIGRAVLGLTRSPSRRAVQDCTLPLMTILLVTVWDILFSPLVTSRLAVVVALAACTTRALRDARRADPGEPA